MAPGAKIVYIGAPDCLSGLDYVNFLDNTEGKFFRLQTVDVQSSTLHDTRGYDDETGVGTPRGPSFLLDAPRR